MKKGFTLVELSIVLVIIGLLIGGILVAQSMIGTAKVQGLVRQVGQFDAAVENFHTKFGQLPGDTNLIGGSKGNNDGKIQEPYPYLPGSWRDEPAKFWADLSVSGLKNSDGNAYIDDSLAGSDITVNTKNKLPLAVAGKQAYFFAAGTLPLGLNYVIGQPVTLDPATFTAAMNVAFKPTDALAIDQKIDDGNPTAGSVKAMSNYSAAYNAALYVVTNNGSITVNSNPETCNDGYPGSPTLGTAYQISNNFEGCILLIRIGTSTGNPK